MPTVQVPSVKVDRSELRRVVDHVSTLVQEERDDWPTTDHRLAASLVYPRVAARRWLYLTKLNWLGGPNAIPDDVGAIQAMGPVDTGLATAIRSITRDCPIWFVGDLDPLDVTAFLSLKAEGLDARYLGIGDDWLRLCVATGMTLPTIALSPFELANLRALEAFDLGALLGEEGAALLSTGHKLELEGASNEAFYGADHTERMRALLFAADGG